MTRVPWVRWLRRSVEAWTRRVRNRDTIFLLFTAALVGLLGGGAALLFGRAIHECQRLAWGAVEPGLELLEGVPWWQMLAVPALGGLCVGLVTTFLMPDAQGHGVPDVIRAVATGGAKIRGRLAIGKTIASALTIGTGGSAGREGPMIQIGAAIGSRVGRTLGMSKARLRTLVGCGAAAGIAATFNAPIAGALFASEVILGEFGAARFGPIVIASVVATTVARSWRGSAAAVFSPPACGVASPWELVPYAVLGLLCGLCSWLYVRANERAERAFGLLGNSRAARAVRPALGGLAVGALALGLPQLLGDGHALTNDAFTNAPLLGVADTASAPFLGVLLLLVLAKIFATSATLGSGGSGGVFSPALAIGALLGAFAGHAAMPLLGARFGGVAAYSLAGMAGLIAGSLMAPMTAILMVFEITSNYAIILPVMLTAILSAVLAGKLTGGLSIYTGKLARDGTLLFRSASPDLLRNRRAADRARDNPPVAPPSAPAGELLGRLLDTDYDRVYVVDGDRRLIGVVTLSDVRRLVVSPAPLASVLLAEDLLRRDVPAVTPSESLSSALAKFAVSRQPELPMVRSSEDPRLIGTLSEADVLAVYQEEMLKADAPSALATLPSRLPVHAPVPVAPGYSLALRPTPAAWLGVSLGQSLGAAPSVRVLLVVHSTPGRRPSAAPPNPDLPPGEADSLLAIAPDDALRGWLELA